MHDLSKLIGIHAENDLYQKLYLMPLGCSWPTFQEKVQLCNIVEHVHGLHF